jgi:hypothetical protein
MNNTRTFVRAGQARLARRAVLALAAPAAAVAMMAATAAPPASAAAVRPAAAQQPAAAALYTGPHFRTPQAAMRYLAAAFNRHDAAAMHHVTTPAAYKQLTAMRSEAVNLRLTSCAADKGRGDFFCTFRHDYPRNLHMKGHGSSRFLVAPARNPGWYMYTLLMCG